MQEYSWDTLRSLFIELFCAPKASLDDPSIRPSLDRHYGRTFFLLSDEVGECQGSFGYWVEDEETGLEGFLDEVEDEFWLFDDQTHCWQVRRFGGRKLKRGKGKGKGRGKGSKGRRFFKPRRGKGRPYGAIAEDWTEEYPDATYKAGKHGGKPKKGPKGTPKGYLGGSKVGVL